MSPSARGESAARWSYPLSGSARRLAAVVAAAVGSAGLVLHDPLLALAAVGLGAAIISGILATAAVRRFVLLLLVAKPLVDLAWRAELAAIGGQRLNPQTLVALLPPLLLVSAIILRPRALVHRLAVYALMASLVVSVAVSPSPRGVNELLRMVSGVAVFFMAGYQLDSSRRLDRFARLLLLIVSAPIALGFLQKAGILGYQYWDWIGGVRLGRVSGTYPHPLGIAYYLIYTTPLALYLLRRAAGVGERLLLWGFLGASLVITALTYHRTTVVTITLQLVLWLVLNRRYRQLLVMVLIGALLLVAFSQPLLVLFENVVHSLAVPVSSADFLRGRGLNWYLFLHALEQSHPVYWLVGKGTSHAIEYIPGVGLYESDEPHDDLIRILYTYGAFGLGAYLFVLLLFVSDAVWLRRHGDEHGQAVGNLLIIAVVSVLLLSATTEPMRYPTASWYLFALGSAATVACRRLGDENWGESAERVAARAS